MSAVWTKRRSPNAVYLGDEFVAGETEARVVQLGASRVGLDLSIPYVRGIVRAEPTYEHLAWEVRR